MKEEKGLNGNIIVQVAVAVEDIKKTAKRIADIFQIEVPEIYDGEVVGNIEEYNGKQSKSYTKTCYFSMGQVDLELIQPTGDIAYSKTAAADFLRKNNGNGIQHISFNIKNIDESVKYLKEKGLRVIQRTEVPNKGIRATFIEFPEIGSYIELLEGETKPTKD